MDDIQKNKLKINDEIDKLINSNIKITHKLLDNMIINLFGDSKNGIFTTYGELTYPNIISDHLKLNHTDVLYDLGSGNGTFCIDICKKTGIKCVGIEYVKSRYDISLQKLKESKEKFDIKFFNGNFLDYSWNNATIIYMCNTCYNDITINNIVEQSIKLPNLRYIISLKSVDNKYNYLFYTEIINVNVTWMNDTINCYIYKFLKSYPEIIAYDDNLIHFYLRKNNLLYQY